MHDNSKPTRGRYNVLTMPSSDKRLNNITYTEYFYRLELIAKALFKWENLPNDMEERWIENYLCWYGGCVFFRHPTFGYMVAQIAETGRPNFYNDPTKIKPIFYNMAYEGPQLINNNNCIIIRNNDDMIPTIATVKFYAYKLANIERTIDTNIIQQKTPLIVHMTDKQKQSYMQAVKERDANEHVIYADKQMDMDSIKTLNTTAPIVFDKLSYQKHMVYNECMTFLGVNNANMDKRERVQSAEVAANDEQIQANEDVMLKARQEAAERINKMFGTNIRVTRRSAQEGPQTAAGGDTRTDPEGGGE